MPDIATPLEMGFAEFVARLISEVFDAVADSQAEQEHRQTDISQMASLSVSDFAEKYVTDEHVDSELVRLFPTDQPKRPHAIFSGSPYKLMQTDVHESPPIGAVLGLELDKGDLQLSRTRVLVLNQNAVDKIKHKVRLDLAQTQLLALRQLIKQGIPRVVVDSGKISAKLTFQVIRTEEAEKPEIASRLAAPLKPLGKVASISAPRTLTNVRLLVRQADARAPQTAQLKGDIFGEVEISFKTVI